MTHGESIFEAKRGREGSTGEEGGKIASRGTIDLAKQVAKDNSRLC